MTVTDLEKCRNEYDEYIHRDTAFTGKQEDEIIYLKLALESSRRLTERLNVNYPTKQFRIVTAFSETKYSGNEIDSYGSNRLSFHEIRPAAEGLFRIDDLNTYMNEAVMNIEI